MSEDPCQCSPFCDDAFPNDLLGWGSCMDSCQMRCSGTPRWNLNLGYAEYFRTKQSISATRRLFLVILIIGLVFGLIFIIQKHHLFSR